MPRSSPPPTTAICTPSTSPRTGVGGRSFPQELLGDLNSMYATAHFAEALRARRQHSYPQIRLNGGWHRRSHGGRPRHCVLGNGRGGSMYYAVDVDLQEHPEVPVGDPAPHDRLAGSARPWSTRRSPRERQRSDPELTEFALVFAGGYDSAEEGTSYQTSDSSGNWIYHGRRTARNGTVVRRPTGATPAPRSGVGRAWIMRSRATLRFG